MNSGTLTLVLGGVRSGKSRFAEQLAGMLDTSTSRDGVLFVATAQAFDSEMKSRIEKHQESRPTTWRLLEQSRQVGEAIRKVEPYPQVILLDCLPLLITNVLCDPSFQDLWQTTLRSEAMQTLQDAVNVEIDAILEVRDVQCSHVIVVSGEVGLGLVPENAMGRAFRDLLGWANQRLANRANETYFLAAGHAIPLKQQSVSVESAAVSLRNALEAELRPQSGVASASREAKNTPGVNTRAIPLAFKRESFLERLRFWRTAHGMCLLLPFFMLLGCDIPDGISVGPTSVTTSSAIPTTVTIQDKLDRTIEFKSVPTRIVSLSPSTTELLFALGLGPSVVGVTEHCNFPPEALQLPRVGSGTLEGISREAILSLRPDLILCKWDSHQPLVETFERVGTPIVGLGPENIAQMFDEARLLGKITNSLESAEQLIQSMEQRLNRLKSIVADVSESEQKRVFYQVWDSPLMTAGPKSFIGELLETAKLKNIFSDLTTRYTRVSSEVIVDRDPEIILAPTTHSVEVKLESFASRPGWDKVSAVKHRRIYIIEGDQVSRCGPRLLDALEQIIQVSYPTPDVDR